ncbi:e3 ubiquitin-protein ligase [Anaeramoeba flamelloides]|uniref:E3 ubiquitin-protein ligase n=1 Tax=Anaeramoeba flamelloides TaxID=1746091 RepID=A0ABQ8YRA7_9EUKA|nr:e3 ubiquitin-protein ligase [Anaeramoeba flamelloides]
MYQFIQFGNFSIIGIKDLKLKEILSYYKKKINNSYKVAENYLKSYNTVFNIKISSNNNNLNNKNNNNNNNNKNDNSNTTTTTNNSSSSSNNNATSNNNTIFYNGKLYLTKEFWIIKIPKLNLEIKRKWDQKLKFFINKPNSNTFTINISKSQQKTLKIKLQSNKEKEICFLAFALFKKNNKIHHNHNNNNKKKQKKNYRSSIQTQNTNENSNFKSLPKSIINSKRFKEKVFDWEKNKNFLDLPGFIEKQSNLDSVNFLVKFIVNNKIQIAPGYLKIREKGIKLGIGEKITYRVPFLKHPKIYQHPKNKKILLINWEDQKGNENVIFILVDNFKQNKFLSNLLVKFINNCEK